jgi:hypothetical protein
MAWVNPEMEDEDRLRPTEELEAKRRDYAEFRSGVPDDAPEAELFDQMLASLDAELARRRAGGGSIYVEVSPEADACRPTAREDFERVLHAAIELDPDIPQQMVVRVLLRRAADGQIDGWVPGTSDEWTPGRHIELRIKQGDADEQFVRTAAHELRHTAQIERGESDDVPQPPDPGYWTHPREVDARQFEDIVCRAMGL